MGSMATGVTPMMASNSVSVTQWVITRKKVLDQRLKSLALIELYRHFNDNTGILHGNNSNGITFEDFKKGSTIIAFDLNPG